MNGRLQPLIQQIRKLPVVTTPSGTECLSAAAVTDTVAAFLFPELPLDEITAVHYEQIALTSLDICQNKMGYTGQTTLTPPLVAFSQSGAYWKKPSSPSGETDWIVYEYGWQEQFNDGYTANPWLLMWDLDEVSRGHFKIPVIPSLAVCDLITMACANPTADNDPKGIWHDILGMCRLLGRDNPHTKQREFSVIITGVSRQTKWRMTAGFIYTGDDETPTLFIDLAKTESLPQRRDILPRRFPAGFVLITIGAVDALERNNLGLEKAIDCFNRHTVGDWGDTPEGDKRPNQHALKNGGRIISTYIIPHPPGHSLLPDKLWIITEGDRSVTTILDANEY